MGTGWGDRRPFGCEIRPGPFWSHVILVGYITATNVNVHFGMRTVERNGFRSPAAFPIYMYNIIRNMEKLLYGITR